MCLIFTGLVIAVKPILISIKLFQSVASSSSASYWARVNNAVRSNRKAISLKTGDI